MNPQWAAYGPYFAAVLRELRSRSIAVEDSVLIRNWPIVRFVSERGKLPSKPVSGDCFIVQVEGYPVNRHVHVEDLYSFVSAVGYDVLVSIDTLGFLVLAIVDQEIR